MQLAYKNKLGILIKNLNYVNKAKIINMQIKYKLFFNKNYAFYVLSNIMFSLLSKNLVKNNSLCVNSFCNYNFFILF
jgi:hypothetical protein